MASIMSTDKKVKLFTEIRDASQGFCNDLKQSAEDLTTIAKKVNFAAFTDIINMSNGAAGGIAVNLVSFDDKLIELSELYKVSPILTAVEKGKFAEFSSARLSAETEFEKVVTEDGSQDYDSSQGDEAVEILKKLSLSRMNMIEAIKDSYQLCVGSDIEAEVRPLLMNLEEACNNYVERVKQITEAAAATTTELNKLLGGIGELASSHKVATYGKMGNTVGVTINTELIDDL